IKEYNGNKINSDIKPNLASNYRTRASLLNKLQYDFRKAIEIGIYPVQDSKVVLTTQYVLKKALENKQSLNLNHNYLRNLRYIYYAFINFLNDVERNSSISLINRQRIQEFLLQYNIIYIAYFLFIYNLFF